MLPEYQSGVCYCTDCQFYFIYKACLVNNRYKFSFIWISDVYCGPARIIQRRKISIRTRRRFCLFYFPPLHSTTPFPPPHSLHFSIFSKLPASMTGTATGLQEFLLTFSRCGCQTRTLMTIHSEGALQPAPVGNHAIHK